MRIILLFFLINIFLFAEEESKSQPSIRAEKKFQISVFKYKNRYNYISFQYNRNESFTFGLDFRQTETYNPTNHINGYFETRNRMQDAYISLQWFPFKVGGLYLSLRGGYYKVTAEEEYANLYPRSTTNFYYGFHSMHLAKPMRGFGIGYKWVFENGITLGFELDQFKRYNRSLHEYNLLIDTTKQINLYDYILTRYDATNFVATPVSLFISIGYSFFSQSTQD